ncbi:formylglycine-generating enzyme family protein [Roseateles sp. LYH14W]|uniref:Formylglycine-generating enzyme family protein n=1 Tax=Pelomonas parva TaxID=3299032 RepID=A0ABW7F056_9BURK
MTCSLPTLWRGLASAALGLALMPAQGTPAVGQTIKDCADCPTLVVLPSGSFLMGSVDTEKGRRSNEGPQHRVTIAYRLAVGQFELTRGEFARFVNASGYRDELSKGEACHVLDGRKWGKSSQHNWLNPGYAQTDEHPVSCVSWHDAQAYLAWLNRQVPGKGYRLLSEAEWEYAARAGQGGRHAWGDDDDVTAACAHANAMDQTGKEQIPDVTWAGVNCADGAAYPVAGPVFKPNAFGLYNMAGNVWEWVQDHGRVDYTGAPTDGSAWTEGGEPNFRGTRGGAWFSYPPALRSAYRGKSAPEFRGGGVGFRIARPL